MATFKDSEKRTWAVNLNYHLLGEIESRTGVAIDKLFDSGSEELTKLGNPRTLFAVLWVLAEEQAGKCGVTPEQFAHGMDGDALEAGSAALLEAFTDFCPSRQRPMIRKLVAKVNEIAELKVQEAVAKIEALGPDPRTPTSIPDG